MLTQLVDISDYIGIRFLFICISFEEYGEMNTIGATNSKLYLLNRLSENSRNHQKIYTVYTPKIHQVRIPTCDMPYAIN